MALFTKMAGALGLRADPRASEEAHARALLASLLSMAWFVEARDPYTGGHLWRVSRYAHMVAERVGLGPVQVARVSLGGFLHDLGKIGVPDAILRKTDRLTEAEYAVIQTHPHMGARMLAGHPLSSLVLDAILRHHERPDGRGYPQGLHAEAIPEVARIVSVCDAFDAMTSHRPYRAGMPQGRALDIIASERDKQFDARFADALIALGGSDQLGHVLGHSDDGIPLQNCPQCGPTLVLTRRAQAGQRLYCRNCGGEFKLAQDTSGLQAIPTGSLGQPADLEPELDLDVIAHTIETAVAALPRQLIQHVV